jgi:bacterioferritin-associated ferredoxin
MRAFHEHLHSPHESRSLPNVGFKKVWSDDEQSSLGVSLLVDQDQIITRFVFEQQGMVAPLYELSFLTEYLPGKKIDCLNSYSEDWLFHEWGEDLAFLEIDGQKERHFWSPVKEIFRAIWLDYTGEKVLSLNTKPLACRCFHFSEDELKKLVIENQTVDLTSLSHKKSFALACRTCVPYLTDLLVTFKPLVKKEEEILVCKCFKVTKNKIQSMIEKNPTLSLLDLKTKSKAGTGCGSCAPQVKEIYDHFQTKIPKRLFKNKSHADWVLIIEKEVNFLWTQPLFGIYPKPQIIQFHQGTIRFSIEKLSGDQEWELSQKLLNQFKMDLDEDLNFEFFWA